MSQRRAVVSVIGKDQIGIISKVTTILAQNQVNILDISQTILQDFFTMMMIVDVTDHQDLEALQKQLTKIGKSIGLKNYTSTRRNFPSHAPNLRERDKKMNIAINEMMETITYGSNGKSRHSYRYDGN